MTGGDAADAKYNSREQQPFAAIQNDGFAHDWIINECYRSHERCEIHAIAHRKEMALNIRTIATAWPIKARRRLETFDGGRHTARHEPANAKMMISGLAISPLIGGGQAHRNGCTGS